MKHILLLVNFSRTIRLRMFILLLMPYFLVYALYRHEWGTSVLVHDGHE
jgi:hypothetical protein